LAPGASNRLWQQLVIELEQLKDTEALAGWARRALSIKNQLAKSDAQAVEDAFAARLARLGESMPDRSEHPKGNGRDNQPSEADPGDQVTVISKPVRERDREHLKFVSSQPCLVCGRTPSDAHHIKFAEQRAVGRKVSDRFTVPICRLHHRELHRRGNERAWWVGQAIDPLLVAAVLWGKTQAAAPTEPNMQGDGDRSANAKADLKGRRFDNATGLVGRLQSGETKPIVRSEAE